MSRPAKTSKKKTAGVKAEASTTQRLQRLLASAGFGSRRTCEELIEAGRVEVDGAIITKLGTTVDSNVSKVRVDGVVLKKQKLVYYAVNKPVGVVTTNSDPHGRPRVVDLVPQSERVFAVGRLDRSSEGLILLTNDGDLAQRLTHPKYGVRKIYRVLVAGKVDGETMKKMRQGIYISEGHVQVDGAKIIKARNKATEMEIVLREGKNREIRRILARLGHKVQQLRRIAVGPLRLGDMPPGAYRVVGRDEVKKLLAASEPTAKAGSEGRGKSADAPRGATKKGGSKSASAKRPASPGTKRPAKTGGSKTGGPTAGGPKTRGPKRSGSAPRGRVEKGPVKRTKGAPARTKASVDRAAFESSGSTTIGSVIGADPDSESEAKSTGSKTKRGKAGGRGKTAGRGTAARRGKSTKRGAGGSTKGRSASSKGGGTRSAKKKSPAPGKRTTKKGPRRGASQAAGKPVTKRSPRKRKR